MFIVLWSVIVMALPQKKAQLDKPGSVVGMFIMLLLHHVVIYLH